jgi:uncharacterized membrane protein YccC
MTQLKGIVRRIREAMSLAPGRPAWAAGLRAAVATVAPLVAATLLGSSGGTWMSLAGFSGALADRGGSYRNRALTMGALTVAGAVAVALGTLAAGRLAIALPLTFLLALCCSLARVWGNAGATVGGSVLNIFVIALAYPAPSPREALSRAGFVVIGGLWAMVLSLVLWPLRPYRPLRLAVAECYRAVAVYAEGLVHRAAEGATAHSGEIPIGAAQVRAALESARAALAAMRRGRPGESGRGEKLLVLREMADQLFGHLVALGDMAETIPGEKRVDSAQRAFMGSLSAVAATARAIAAQIEAERDPPDVTVSWSGELLRTAIDTDSSPDTGHPDSPAAHYAQAALLLDRLAQYASAAAATAATLNGGHPVPAADGVLQAEAPEPPRSLLAQLREVLAPDSVVLRYALRMAIVVTAAVLLTSALHLPRGYWVTITIVIILQPYTGATSLKALQRVLGTVLGGILTAGLGAVFHDPRAILPLAFVFACLSVALLPLNYAAFSVFLTPTFVLLAEASVGDWHLAGVRILNTLLGGVLALLGARFLWPSSESSRLPNYVATVLRANRDYLHAGVTLFRDRSQGASRELRAARRVVGLAAANAEESFQRLLGEHGGAVEAVAPIMTLLTYSRRLTASIAALAITRHASDAPTGPLGEFLHLIEPVLDDLAASVTEQRSPAPFPSVDILAASGAALPPPVRARLTRIVRQVETLHGGVRRWVTGGHEVPEGEPSTRTSGVV